MIKNKLLLPLSLLTIMLACGGSSNLENEKKAIKKDSLITKQQADSLPKKNNNLSYNNKFNNTSKVLSGINDNSNGLNFLLDSSAWKENKTFIDDSWKKLEKSRLTKLEAWSSKELSDANANISTVFYPFSGPDFLTANAFFPNLTKIIMLGLEPIGELPELEKYKYEDAKSYCNSFKSSLNDIFNRSYFITQYMLRDFQKQKVNGLLPVLCFFISRTGHEITDIKYIYKLNNDSLAENADKNSKKTFGVKVTCEKNGIKKQIYYFKYDVSNKQFSDTNVFYKFINKHTKPSVTYIKSASYLLHANFMSNMKKIILNNSNFLLEDDTGIPYNDIEKAKNWKIKLYGKYTQPVKDFPYLKLQTGIVKAFEKDSANIPNLPFHLGYHWQNKKDLLIYCKKK
ncbi:MAG: hypothetical protein JSU07_10195 [Bacteroidetes bacterium]|nr:hypothetical protein [Bacteroidota bacterium]